MRMGRKLMLLSAIVLLMAGCAASKSIQAQGAPDAAATATRVRQRPTPTPEALATATVTPTAVASPTIVPTVAPSVAPMSQPTTTTAPLRATVATVNSQMNSQTVPAAPAVPPTTGGVSAGVLLPLDPSKYPVPTLLAPDNNVTYHVSQPVVHFAWSPTPTDLMTFGQTPGCVSDVTNFRRAFESYQLIIHSLEGVHPDLVQWNENNPTFDLNLTTVPAGHYSWRVNVVTLCESYVVGQRNDTHPLYGPQHNSDPAYHKSTLERSFVAPASPTSATRMINWVP